MPRTPLVFIATQTESTRRGAVSELVATHTGARHRRWLDHPAGAYHPAALHAGFIRAQCALEQSGA